MQRVKVGLTGLAIVLLLIALASAVLHSVSREHVPAVPGAPRPELVANLAQANMADSTNEPLAEIGAAPSGQGNDSARSPQPAQAR